LTCFSYYYQGLSETHLDQCFDLLHKQANPPLEYEKWIANDSCMPKALRELCGVNTTDPKQRSEYLLPRFRRNYSVIDFFLSQVVFPREAKEFSKKLATSGWDLVETKSHFTTGFSGTNDGRYLLPTSIVQRDPVGQLSTNAKVLTYLLQPENSYYECIYRDDQNFSTDNFLNLMVSHTQEIRVLLDVGAQILELKNVDLAERWLNLRPDIDAVIFFDRDELAVLTRDGNVETYISSPFNQRADKCLVYLDDAHTRGTDLKLPTNFRAAVTLGPKVTKDKLLQGHTIPLTSSFAILTSGL
jgi:hypothetical protein